MEIATILNALFGVLLASLAYFLKDTLGKIKEVEKDLQLVKLTYASKDEIKEIKDLIERGFDKLEVRLDKKQDRDH